MALVQTYGRPDIFITITCNPRWPEITSELMPMQTPQDRPDLTARIFRMKLEELKKDLYNRNVLGRVVAHMHVIEFQKRGLPHAHLLLILNSEDKIRGANDYDAIISAEMPNPIEQPILYQSVITFMIHGPCGHLNRNAPCMKDNKCTKCYPKEFLQETREGDDSYPLYHRRDNEQYVLINNKRLDNRWIIPYNPYLTFKYNCHINVEVCSSIKSVKYLYKYLYKGHDRAALQVTNNDEISQYLDARWISSSEACWRIFGFDMSHINPSVFRLQIHLPGQQNVTFKGTSSLSNIINDEQKKMMLTEYFESNKIDPDARNYTYREFSQHYIWNNTARKWTKRCQGKAIGRIYAVSPSKGERYYLRLLLNNVKGAISFNDLKIINN